MVFQDPFSSLNPVLPGLARHPARAQAAPPELGRRSARREAERVFEVVGLPGGRDPGALPARAQRRTAPAGRLRAGARDRPKLILADEPVSMLDVSIRIGLLNLMAKLRDERGRLDPVHHP